MLQSQFVRYLHRSFPTLSSASKSHLAKLRKKTGYTFSNCKKALEVNDNDVVKAEKWLQDQAEALGWSKLSKLEGRVTAQGLVCIAFEGKTASMVEINCETDFVARNKNFKEMVGLAASSCLKYVEKSKMADNGKTWLDCDQLKTVEGPNQKTLADHVALLVSSVGENISLRRAVCVGANEGKKLACYTHPRTEESSVASGKYGAILTYSAPKYNATTEQIAKQLCQHVVGMNPKTINKHVEEQKIENIAKQPKQEPSSQSETPNKDIEDEVGLVIDEEKQEDAMLAQDFLLDPTLTVEELLEGAGITIHDFVRFETGERIVTNEESVPELKASQMGG